MSAPPAAAASADTGPAVPSRFDPFVPLRRVHVDRYVTPLREGGSLPAIVEADDCGLYVLKFRGAGQGPKALVAEIIAAGLARVLGLAVPEVVLADLDPELARTEPDPEIQDLIRASAGTNVALDYLPGSANFDPVADRVDGDLASTLVWFDALVSNVDRTARNTNLLTWHRRLWLIDHGAAFYFHHSDGDWLAGADKPFSRITDHVLLLAADRIRDLDVALAARLTRDVIAAIVGNVPDDWFVGRDAVEGRAAYVDYLVARLASRDGFVGAAIAAADAARANAGDRQIRDPARSAATIRAGRAYGSGGSGGAGGTDRSAGSGASGEPGAGRE